MNRLVWSLGLPAMLIAAMFAWGHDPEGKDGYAILATWSIGSQ